MEAGRPFGSDIKLKSRREEENLEGAQDTDTARSGYYRDVIYLHYIEAGGPGKASMEEREDREHSEEMGLMGQEEVASSPVGPPVWRRGQSKGQNNIRAGSDIAGRSSQGTGHVAQRGRP